MEVVGMEGGSPGGSGPIHMGQVSTVAILPLTKSQSHMNSGACNRYPTVLGTPDVLHSGCDCAGHRALPAINLCHVGKDSSREL